MTTTSTSAAGSGGTTAAGSGDSTTAGGTAGGTTTGAPGDGETTTEMQSGSIGQGNSGATAAMCVLPSLGPRP